MEQFDLSPVICLDPGNINKWIIFTSNLLKFLKLYKELLDSYVVDFYSKDLWNTINHKWMDALKNLGPTDISNFINRKCCLRGKRVFPLSLLAFRATCFSFVLPRDPSTAGNGSFPRQRTDRGPQSSTKDSSSPRHRNAHRLTLGDRSEIACKRLGNPGSKKGGGPLELEHVFRKHVKPKKRHEVARMGHVSSLLFRATGATVAVDVGSGQGHLARVIGYGFGVPTICLDAEEDFIHGARKFDRELETFWRKKKLSPDADQDSLLAPRHATCRLDPRMTGQDFAKLVREKWPELSSTNGSREISFTLVGLHCCGDLGPTLLRVFTTVASCKALLLVGCCYMKLSTQDSSEAWTSLEGYPMSAAVRGNGDWSAMSYNAREVACHAMEGYALKLMKGADDQKVHCYRAVLEQLIVRKRSALRHSGLRPVNNAHLLPFAEYVGKTVCRLEGLSFSDHELDTAEVRAKLRGWMNVVLFYSLRLMLAPAVESLIMLDRLFYLHEKTKATCFITPLFDPTISPRNYALVAMKEQQNEQMS